MIVRINRGRRIQVRFNLAIRGGLLDIAEIPRAVSRGKCPRKNSHDCRLPHAEYFHESEIF
jgi:hypothetical protein